MGLSLQEKLGGFLKVLWSSRYGGLQLITGRYDQENNNLKFDNITSVGFWVGLALIVLAWIKAVPLSYGWVGLGIALPSFIVEAIKKNLASSSTDDNSQGRPKN